MEIFQDPRCEVDAATAVSSNCIEVVVGPEKRTFHVHEKHLRSGSAFFAAALSERWQKQDDDYIVELLEDDAPSFGRFVHWLYSGKIASKLPTGRTNYIVLIQLYILGEKLIASAFQDRVLDAIVAGTRVYSDDSEGVLRRRYPTKGSVCYVYEGTPQGSPLRRLMVDLHLQNALRRWLDEENTDNNHHDFLVDLAAAALDELNPESVKRAYSELDAGSPCSYHKHGKEEPCPGKSG